MDKKFTEKIKKDNRLKPISDAFKEYPVEEEIHHVNIDYFIAERTILYSYNVGDIVFVPDYEYHDKTTGKNHLFVIIDENDELVPLEYFGLLISSNLSKLKFKENVLLKKDKLNNLLKDSLIKTDFVYSLTKDMIAFKIGSVTIDKVNYFKKLVNDYSLV